MHVICLDENVHNLRKFKFSYDPSSYCSLSRSVVLSLFVGLSLPHYWGPWEWESPGSLHTHCPSLRGSQWSPDYRKWGRTTWSQIRAPQPISLTCADLKRYPEKTNDSDLFCWEFSNHPCSLGIIGKRPVFLQQRNLLLKSNSPSVLTRKNK